MSKKNITSQFKSCRIRQMYECKREREREREREKKCVFKQISRKSTLGVRNFAVNLCGNAPLIIYGIFGTPSGSFKLFRGNFSLRWNFLS
jgi:hypothetical protein